MLESPKKTTRLSEAERREKALGHECPDCGGLIQIVPASVMHEAHEEGEVARRCLLCPFICYIGDDPLHYSLEEEETVITPIFPAADAFRGFNEAVKRMADQMAAVVAAMSIPPMRFELPRLPSLTLRQDLEELGELITGPDDSEEEEPEEDGDDRRYSDM